MSGVKQRSCEGELVASFSIDRPSDVFVERHRQRCRDYQSTEYRFGRFGSHEHNPEIG